MTTCMYDTYLAFLLFKVVVLSSSTGTIYDSAVIGDKSKTFCSFNSFQLLSIKISKRNVSVVCFFHILKKFIDVIASFVFCKQIFPNTQECFINFAVIFCCIGLVDFGTLADKFLFAKNAVIPYPFGIFHEFLHIGDSLIGRQAGFGRDQPVGGFV